MKTSPVPSEGLHRAAEPNGRGARIGNPTADRGPAGSRGAHDASRAGGLRATARRLASAAAAALAARHRHGRSGLPRSAWFAAAVFLLSGPLATTGAHAQGLPEVTIKAAQIRYGLGLDDVTFILSRTGSTESELSVGVSLTQAETYLEASNLDQTVTIPAGSAEADLILSRDAFLDGTQPSGSLAAEVVAGTGYTVGRPMRATTTMVALATAITVRIENPSYRLPESGGASPVVLVARTVGDQPQPDLAFAVSLSDRALEDEAESPADYGALAVTVSYEMEDFMSVDGVWEARKEATLTIVDDDLDESDEMLDLELAPAPGLPVRVLLRLADGSACPVEGCRSRVTITDDDKAPSAPRELAFLAGNGEVTLSWTASENEGTSEVTGHEYRVSADAGMNWDPDWTDIANSAPGETNATGYTVEDLDNGVKHTFEIRAVSDAGESAAAQATATPVGVPSVPRNLSLTPGDGEVTLSWTASEDEGTSAVTGHRYRVSDDGGMNWDPDWTDITDSAPGEDNETGYTVENLDNGVKHIFEIRAVNANGESIVAQGTATPMGAPSVPRNLSLTPGDGEVTLSWEASESNGGSAVTGHQFRVSDDAGTSWDPDWTDITDSAPGEDNETGYTVENLDNGVQHTFEIRAVNANGESAAAQGTATPVGAPSVPRNLSLTPGDGEVTLSWEASESNGGSAVTGHQFRVSDDAGTSWDPDWTDITDSAPGEDNATGYTVENLDNGVQHTFEIRAVNANGESAAARGTATPVRPDPELTAMNDIARTRTDQPVTISGARERPLHR